MMLEVCAVFDTASGVYARPIFVASVGVGVRMFTDEVNRVAVDNVMNQHPGDFQLFHLATFDDVRGVFEMVGKSRLVTGSDVFVVKGGV